MPIYRVDILIKRLRRQKRLTQKQLALGICSQETLSRIERGERMPERQTFDRLMQRLGQNPQQYYSTIISWEDKKSEDIKSEIGNLIVRKKYTEAMQRIAEVKKLDLFKNGYNLQFIYHSEAACIIGMPCDKDEINRAYELSIKALEVTIPGFEESKIDSYVLGYSEIIGINTLAVIHDKLSGIEAATEIFIKLQTAMRNNYIGELDQELAYRYLPILFNVSRNLRRLQKYDECIAVCDEGIELSEKHYNSYQLPKLIAMKSACLFAIAAASPPHSDGDPELRGKATELFEQACHLFIGLKRHAELEGLKQEFKDIYGVD